MIQEAARQLESRWSSDERWRGIERTYTAEQVVRLRGSVDESDPAADNADGYAALDCGDQ